MTVLSGTTPHSAGFQPHDDLLNICLLLVCLRWKTFYPCICFIYDKSELVG